MPNHYDFACETARLVDLGIKLQHFGMDSLIPAIQKTLYREKPVVEPTCGFCDSILTEEEEEHCGVICFDCAERATEDVGNDWKHPDQQ